MESIRIGNDINIEWSILRNGDPETLEGKDLRVVMTNGYRKMEVKDLHFRDNVIRFTYLGKDQDYNGVYTLTLIENKGKEGMYTVDACDAFRLIPRSCSVGGDTGCGSVKVTTVRLTGDISVPAVGTGDYESMTNKPRINGVELVGDKSLEELGIPIMPDNIVTDADYTHTDNNYTDEDKGKLDGLDNYDDTDIRNLVTGLRTDVNKLKPVVTSTPSNGQITITPDKAKNDDPDVSITLETKGDNDKSLMADGKYRKLPVYGRNLLLGSGKEVSNSNYPIASYWLTESIQKNAEVTCTIWGDLGEGLDHFLLFNSGDRGDQLVRYTPEDFVNGKASKTFKWRSQTTDGDETSNTFLRVYAFPRSSTTSTIHKIKLEYGDISTEWDGTYRSLLGFPVTNLTRDQFRQAARKRGSGWEMYTYNAHKTLFWLFAVEYATLDSQKPFNAQKDANGFAQGGLGPGPTQMADWTNFNNANPLIPCGYTNEFGNGSGEKAYVVKNASGGTHATLMANRYRGIENPFGHIWKYTDGANIQVTTGDAGLSILWTTDDPSNFSDTSYTGYDKKGNICRTNGYAKKMLLGEDGDIVATEIGGSSSTYWCDYYYTYTSANRMQVVLVGGNAGGGSSAGLAYVHSTYAPSGADRHFGSRLCFFPEFRKTSA